MLHLFNLNMVMEKVVTLGGGCNHTSMVLQNNQYFTKNGTAMFYCGYSLPGVTLNVLQSTFPLLEVGSTVDSLPSSADMIAWVAEKIHGYKI